MKTKYIIIILQVFISISCSQPTKTFTKSEISIVPKPTKIEIIEQSFRFPKTISVAVTSKEQNPAASYMIGLCENAKLLEISSVGNLKVPYSIVFLKDANKKPEGYGLKITKEKIEISANDAAGYFYGVQTLRQLLPPNIETANKQQETWIVPCIDIDDSPRFKWRGMHMDFSRHFFSIDEVKTFLDYMALYKLNTYHMHLTDDQGWRVEIKKYPLLTENGAWRTENENDKVCIQLSKTNPLFIINEQHYHNRNGKRMYGGFFTQKQIKEIVEYAAERQIEVVPEIDMPGHFKSAIDNYPFLACNNESGWGDHFSIPACLGKESSYQFTKNILAEIADLFPSKYIHIGGDEVNMTSWKTCKHCQKTIEDNGLKNEKELQSFFNRNIEKFLNSKQKKLIGWDEIVEGGLSKNATIMWWRNWAPKAPYIAASNGNDIVITPDFEYYFDFKNEETPLEKVYKYEPVPKDFTPEQENHILGVQANLWSEYIPNFKRLQYQAFPRLLALAESGWTAKNNKKYQDFQQRLDLQYLRLDALNIQYYIPSVVGLKNKVGFLDKAIIELKTPLDDMQIFYTLDGSLPSKSSLNYKKPIEITKTTTLSTIAYRGNIASEVKSALVEKQSYIEAVSANPTAGTISRWTTNDQFDVVEDVVLPDNPAYKYVREFDLEGFEDSENVSMVFKGYFLAETDGLYEFATKSDDGSLVYIADKLVVDNGGNHAAITRDGMVALRKGWHPMTVKYHEQGGGNVLTVWYKAPNAEKQILNGKVIGCD